MKKNFKYLIGYFYNDYNVKPLHAVLPKTIANAKIYDGQTNRMYFLIENDEFLEKYNCI